MKAWNRLLDKAETRLELASSYWTLLGTDVGVKHESTWKGENIFKRLNDGMDTIHSIF